MDIPAEKRGDAEITQQTPISDIRGRLESHPGKDLNHVMDDILRSGTDESYCFVNEGDLRRNVGIFRDHFLPNDPERRIIYAMKANPRERILKVLADEGVDGFDCASAGEIREVLSMGDVNPEDIYFNNPVKRKSEVFAAYGMNVRYFTAQSRSGVNRVLEPNKSFQRDDLEVAARIETQNPAAGINLSEKYGCSPQEGLALLSRIRNSGALPGLAINTGSQNPNPESFVAGMELMKELAILNGGVSSINLGGGVPVNYGPEDRHNVQEYLQELSKAVQRVRGDIFRSDLQTQPKIIIEPGRSLVASSVTLAIPILEIDENRRHGKRRVFMNDGVFTSFSDSPIHGWEYNFEVFTRDGRKLPDNVIPHTLYGRTCDSGDSLGGVLLPSGMKEGDFLVVRNAGAYMDSQASGFNGFGTPHYVSYNTKAGRSRWGSGTRMRRPNGIGA